MANSSDSDNNMQFFFTLGEATELQNTHTIFGKVTGETVYNMLKLEECETDHNDRPLYPHKINKVSILNNPFEDIEKRVTKSRDDYEMAKKEPKNKSKMEAVKNFKLLSFGEEEEENEKEIKVLISKTKSKVPETKIRKDVESTKPSTSKEIPKKSHQSSSDDSESEGEQKNKRKEKPANDSSDSDSDYALSLERERKKEIESKK